MNVLITGISGFVGTHLGAYLSGEHRVTGVSRTLSDDRNLLLAQLNTEVMDQHQAIIHLAGIAHDTKAKSRKEEYMRFNTELTSTLFDLFLKSSCEIFVFVSSVKAVSDGPVNPLYETTKPSPNTIYGKSKLAAEENILGKTMPANKRVYILRPCMIHGPGNKGNLNLLYNILLKMPYPFGKFENRRSFLSIDNFCYLIGKILDKKIDSGVYNFADDEALSTNEIVEIISTTHERKIRILRIPKWIIGISAGVGDILGLPINSARLQKLTEDYVVSNQKIKAALQIDKLPVSCREGLTITLKSFS